MDEEETGQPQSGQPPCSRGLPDRWLARTTALFIGSIAVGLVLYAASLHSFGGNSDGATVVLEGQAMSGGNLTLHGWSMTLESFWAIDALVYAAVIRVIGFHAALLHIVPALIATLTILVGGYLASKGARGVGAVAGACTVIALLAFPSPDLAYFFLSGPLHVCTALWCLVVIVGASCGRIRGWIIAVAFLAAGLLGDFIMVAIGLVPCLVTGIVPMVRRRSWRAGWTLVGIAPAAVVLALGLRAVANLFGTFVLVNRNFVVSIGQIGWNLRHLPLLLLRLLGVGRFAIDLSAGPTVLQVAHLAGVLVCGAGVVFGLGRVVLGTLGSNRRLDVADDALRIDSLLTFGLLGDLATFVLFSPTPEPSNARYLTPGVIFASVLAGRTVARSFVRWRAGWQHRVGMAAASVVVVCFALDVLSYTTGPVPRQPVAQLTAFLEQHGLTMGAGDYWTASLATVASSGQLVVRPLTAGLFGHLTRDDRQSAAEWYAGQPFEFFVYDTVDQSPYVNARSAIAMYGPPVNHYRVGVYRVLEWSHAIVFSSALPPQPNPLHIDWIP